MTARRLRAAVVGVLVALALAGCAHPELDPARARALQGDVLAVTEAVAEGRLDAASVLLEQVRRGAEDARTAGDLSEDRYADVVAALDDVAARLDADLAVRAAAAQAEAAAAQDAAVAAAVAEAAEAAAREAAAQEAGEREAVSTTVPPAGAGTVRTGPPAQDPAPQDARPPGHQQQKGPPGHSRGKGPGKDG